MVSRAGFIGVTLWPQQLTFRLTVQGGKASQVDKRKSGWQKGLTPRKTNTCTGLDRPLVFQKVDAPRISRQRLTKMARLSALRTDRLYSPGEIPGTHFCYRPSRLHGHNEARKIRPMKNPNYPTGNRTRDILARSAAPQPTAPPPNPSYT